MLPPDGLGNTNSFRSVVQVLIKIPKDVAPTANGSNKNVSSPRYRHKPKPLSQRMQSIQICETWALDLMVVRAQWGIHKEHSSLAPMVNHLDRFHPKQARHITSMLSHHLQARRIPSTMIVPLSNPKGHANALNKSHTRQYYHLLCLANPITQDQTAAVAARQLMMIYASRQ